MPDFYAYDILSDTPVSGKTRVSVPFPFTERLVRHEKDSYTEE